MIDLSQTGNGSAVHIKCYVFILLVLVCFAISVVFFYLLFCFVLLLKFEVPVIFRDILLLVVFVSFFSVRCFFVVCFCCVINFF